MTDLLSPGEAQLLADARDVLQRIVDDAFRDAQRSDATNAEYYAGYVGATCKRTREAITDALIILHTYGESHNAKAVL